VYLRLSGLLRTTENWTPVMEDKDMAEALIERVRRYILDGTDQDLRRHACVIWPLLLSLQQLLSS
jgi:hypothetical protein